MKAIQKKIIYTLIEHGEMTSYKLGKVVKKPIPSIDYALQELIENGTIVAKKDKTTLYDIHPFFRDREAMDDAGKKIAEILKTIDSASGEKVLTADGYFDLLEIIIDSIEVEGNNNS